MKEPEHYLTPILNLLYNATLSHLKKLGKNLESYNKKIRILEFQTITLGSSRRMGNTYAIASLIKDKNLKSIYIGMNDNMTKMFKRHVKNMDIENVKSYSCNQLELVNLIRSDLNSGDIDLVVVEVPVISTKKKRKNIKCNC